MAGSLIKIDEEIVTSAVASVTLGGTNWDSSYDVYMVRFSNVIPTTDAKSLYARILKNDNTADSTANYDTAQKTLITNASFVNTSRTNETQIDFQSLGTNTGEQLNGILYLFNFNNASEYNFLTTETTGIDSPARLIGGQGGYVHTVSQNSKGLEFTLQSSDNFTSGKFTLYGLKK